MQFEMPKPGPEHAALSAMCGEFEGDETMMPSPWSPEERRRTSRVRSRMMDGFFVISDYEQWEGEAGTFQGHGVYSWDPRAKCYKMYWFDSMGGAGGVADGQLEGNVLTFRNQSPMGHNRYRYVFGDDEYQFDIAMSQDGTVWDPMMEARYRKVQG